MPSIERAGNGFPHEGPEHRAAENDLDPSAVRLLHAFVVTVGCFALLAACLVLLGGWLADMDVFKSVIPGSSTMRPNTALSIAALGMALFLTSFGFRTAGNAASGLALLIGLVTLAEHVFQWDAGIDQLLFEHPAMPPARTPGRPPFSSALMLALLGAAQLCIDRPRLTFLKTSAAAIASLVAWATLNGYVFGADVLRAPQPFSSVAVHSSMLLLLIGMGVLAADPISWPVRPIVATGSGGVICRWLLPPAVLAPPLLGRLLESGSAAARYPIALRWAMYASILSVGWVWLILMLARRITVIEAERAAASALSRHDPLTGLANRRALDTFLLKSLHLSRRHSHPLSLLLLDVDRFKSYNDTFGHLEGDELLKKLGVLLSSLARETDLVARFGGEEFAIVLPETDAAGALVMAERVRMEVERSSQFRRQVTVSVGVATLSAEMSGPSALVEACDLSLYRAKNAGRNRVCAHGTPEGRLHAGTLS